MMADQGRAKNCYPRAETIRGNTASRPEKRCQMVERLLLYFTTLETYREQQQQFLTLAQNDTGVPA